MSNNSQPPQDEIKRVLVVMAHPDDPEFGTGGTTAKWAREGKEIAYVIVTDGSKGSDDPEMTWEKLVPLRQVEQRAAAQVLGVKEVFFLTHRDGELMPDLNVRRDICREIRRWKPDVVFTHDPTTRYGFPGFVNHADHRATGNATLDAVFPAAGNRLYFPELLAMGFEPHKVRQILLTGNPNPDFFVDITDSIEVKVESLREHKSQIKDVDGLAKRLMERHQKIGEAHNMKYAEGFKSLKMG
ncbi:MAG: PIG-L family deacetylase [Chloroflexi bacterium]|nr:PIG-L family deacetylase [Chloroflexota bacterium]